MDKKKYKSKILIIKQQTFKARACYQIPFYLCYLVYQLDGSEEINYIKFLMEMTKHYLRIKNYYKLYPLADKEAEKLIKDGLFKMGYSVIDVHA